MFSYMGILKYALTFKLWYSHQLCLVQKYNHITDRVDIPTVLSMIDCYWCCLPSLNPFDFCWKSFCDPTDRSQTDTVILALNFYLIVKHFILYDSCFVLWFWFFRKNSNNYCKDKRMPSLLTVQKLQCTIFMCLEKCLRLQSSSELT